MNESRAPMDKGRRKGYVSGLPPARMRPLTASPIRFPGMARVSRPTSPTSRSSSEPGPPKRCAPRLSQYGPRGSERIRPPTRSLASSTRMSRSRSVQAAVSPAIPAPTITAS